MRGRWLLCTAGWEKAALAAVAAAGLLAGAAHAQTALPAGAAQMRPVLAETSASAELPPDVAVVKPDAAALEGGRSLLPWSGIWRGSACRFAQCDVEVAVEKLSADAATVGRMQGFRPLKTKES